MINTKLQWYLIHCKPREDERALQNLQRQGFECYLPVLPVERVRKRCRYRQPLFPRYLFIHLDSVNDNWYPIRSTRGVQRLVRFSDHPLPVRDEIIEEIRHRLTGEIKQELYLKSGARVQITEGVFSQLEAIFLTHDGDERVVLLLNIMQTDQALRFPLQAIRKLA